MSGFPNWAIPLNRRVQQMFEFPLGQSRRVGRSARWRVVLQEQTFVGMVGGALNLRQYGRWNGNQRRSRRMERVARAVARTAIPVSASDERYTEMKVLSVSVNTNVT
jgi:hypothetical protein